MSHELRTPLNAIVGFSQLIADEALGAVGHPNYKTFAQDIQKSGEHLTGLVSDILDITRLKAGTFTFRPQPIRLGPTIDAVVRSMQQAASDAQIALTSNAASDIAVMADPTAAERVLRNILSNAIKFTPKGGRVEISVLEAKDGMVGLAVKDNGIGIPPAKQAAIFEPFEQVNSSFVRAQQGPSLGLSIVKSLMEGQGGRVDLESEVGAGTTMTLRFKQAEPLTVAASAAAKPARRSMMAAPKAEQVDQERQAG
ncbi:MAG: HAMP domain-containing histidine kinase [Alphaproteobacteria bacterium]|nr:HAMP domain-containing histidine kinase [Alphaproteobacteria bacterium]